MSKPRATEAGKSHPPAGSPEKAAASTASDKPKSPPGHAIRETVESIAIAVVLAFLFRAFVAEAFVIPTGSMAPTLMGQHKDVECPECGFWYQAGASIEIDDEMNAQRMLEGGRLPPKGVVVATTCPLCRYRQVLDLNGNANQKTFSGDRILVSKFIYDFTSPQRWDVIVFKYPFNAKQNFIKRLVGLPNETILIKRGDVFVKQSGEDEFTIARKPDRKLDAMLQLVDDTRHISRTLSEIGWPLRWQGWSADGRDVREEWTTADGGHTYSTTGKPGEDRWLRYRHIVPSFDEWRMIEQGERPVMPEEIPAELITDFYAYNAFTSVDPYSMSRYDPRLQPEQYARPLFGSASLHPFGTLGLHWVGDLALEAEVEVGGDSGELLLKLVKGGVSYDCRIDLPSGTATLSIDGGRTEFVGSDGRRATASQGATSLRQAGKYRVRYLNIDAELRLWIDGRAIEFDGPTTYLPDGDARPFASAQEPGDLAPVGIGAQGVSLRTERLRVLRDVYYIATDGNVPHEYDLRYGSQQIRQILQDPNVWASTPLFGTRREFLQTMGPDQFFPMGDNSPQSSDARMWDRHYVDRELLIGRALLIYWPHPWYRPIPYLPNFQRMQLIQ